MKPKLIGLFLVAGLIPIIIVGFWSSRLATKALMTQSFNQLSSVRGIKKAQIETYFAERQGDMGVLMETVDTLRSEAFNKLEALKNVKKMQIESYFVGRLKFMKDVEKNLRFTGAIKPFSQAFTVLKKQYRQA